MKIRHGFVSNSSSSSFVVVCVPWIVCEESSRKKLLTREQEDLLIKYGFKRTTISNPSTIENDPLSLTGEIREGRLGKDYNYAYNVSCNQQDVIDFLTEHRIPFKAVTNYDTEVVIYNGEDTYFVIPNLGNRIAMYGHRDVEKEVLEAVMYNNILPREVLIKEIKDSFNREVKKRKTKNDGQKHT